MAEPPVDVGVDDVHAAPRKIGHRALDMILALSAIAISLISLAVAFDNGRTQRQLVAASTWPFLVYTSEVDGAVGPDRTIVMRLRNSGVGPARIVSAVVRLDGVVVRDFRAYTRRCCGARNATIADAVRQGLVSENALAGVVQAREDVNVLVYRRRPGNAAFLEAFERAVHRVAFDVCYCSVLDECWRTDLKSSSRPRSVSDCVPSPDDYRG